MWLDTNADTVIVIYKPSGRTRTSTKQRVFLIFKVGADWVAATEPSKFSCIESKIGELGVILWAKMDPAVGVWLFDRYLADLMNSKQNEFINKNF